MSENLQYDASLGGTQEVPDKLTLLYFTSARAKEIQEVKQILKAPSGTKMAFQRLPNHMRRRIMSHNSKRLPRRLREIHLSQLKKSGLPPKQKRPSRKYRRRPYNLVEEYAKRQRNNNWLETHIWHAKRFHIIQKWGYRLPERPCDKAFRACYRASAKNCIIQDISYFRCIEVSGNIDILRESFKTVCDTKLGLSIGAKAYTEGNREGHVIIYNNTKGVKSPIGPVSFYWRPNISTNRTVWLWVHAAYYNEVIYSLKDCFACTEINRKFVNNDTNIILAEIDINRFQLTGPLSYILLRSMLQMPDENNNSAWWKNYLLNTPEPDLINKHCEFWNNFQPSEFLSNKVLSLNVRDPRFNMPKTRTKPIVQCDIKKAVQLPKDSALGAIWDENIRVAVKQNKISNSKIADMRSELLVPGSELDPSMAEVIPIMIIQKPGNRDSFIGYGSGCDLVVPSGWGNTFWMSLTMWGGRAGGLREFNSIRYESGLPPYMQPDTQAGKEEEQAIKEKYEKRYFSLPPNKRPNYTKLGAIQPFSLNWKILIQDWSLPSTCVNNFQVLREKSKLKTIQDFINNRLKSIDIVESNYLVPVRLTMEKKGMVKDFAYICLSKQSDLISKQMLLEPLTEDSNQLIRKEMRSNHKVLLKKLRRKRVQAKRSGKIIPKDLELLKTYNEKMKKLWLPPVGETVRFSCSRELIGYVVSGGFSFLRANSYGIGYIALGAFNALGSNECRNKVLVRNVTSQVYRTAMLEIIC